SVNSCVVNGVRFVVHSRDERRTTQNCGICSPGLDGEMYYDVARGHGGDGGRVDRPLPYQVPTGCGGCLGNRGKGTRKPNLGGRRAGRQHTRQETRNLGLKAIMDKSGPVLIRFEVDDRETLMPLGDHAVIGPTTSGSSLGSCPCTTFLGAKCHRSGRRGSWQRLGPNLTCVHTWNLTAGPKYMRVSNSTFKRSTMKEGCRAGSLPICSDVAPPNVLTSWDYNYTLKRTSDANSVWLFSGLSLDRLSSPAGWPNIR
nr:S-adenosyl-L-methionine-dependent methyltransferases superfamily protein [Tanacetum cinerariifolium]